MRKTYFLSALCVIMVFNTLLFSNTFQLSDVSKLKTLFVSSNTLEASISGEASVCIDDNRPKVTITVQGGEVPYEIVYTVNGEVLTVTHHKPEYTIFVETSSLGSFTYSLVSVKDSTSPTPQTLQVDEDDVTVKITAAPQITEISFDQDVCSGEEVIFSALVDGDEPLIYFWNFGDNTTATGQNVKHTFNGLGCGQKEYTVSLTVTDQNGCAVSEQRTITVKERPEINFKDVTTYFPEQYFNNCGKISANNPNYTIGVENLTTSNCVTSYKIDWGDNSSSENVSFPMEHTYTSYGAFEMTITATGDNGCESTKTYTVKNVSNPAGGISSPGGTQNICAPTEVIEFLISNWGANSLDTEYIIDFGDGKSTTYTQRQMQNSEFYNTLDPYNSANYPVFHSYAETSCPGEYTVKITIRNACKETTGTIANILVLQTPEADFMVPTAGCTDSETILENTTSVGYGASCNKSILYTWDYGDGSPVEELFSDGATNGDGRHNYKLPGTYTVKLTADNGVCQKTEIEKEICIEAPLVPDFNIDIPLGCGPLEIQTTNTTDDNGQCQPATYEWSVEFSNDFCGNDPAIWNFTNGTDKTSKNPTFNFETAGTYTIWLTAKNSCGEFKNVKEVQVTAPPQVSINPISDSCGTTVIKPTAEVDHCSPLIDQTTYLWEFPGGNPSTSNLATPPEITYDTPGAYELSLTVTNACGSETTSEKFIINPIPALTNTTLQQEICSGNTMEAIALESSTDTTTFNWTSTATSGISGHESSGNGSEIPAATLTNSNNTVGSVIYTITPEREGCIGQPVDYSITVNPSPSINQQPIGETLCQNGPSPILEIGVANAIYPVQYQWFENDSENYLGAQPIIGAVSSTYEVPTTAVVSKYYFCEISFAQGSCDAQRSDIVMVAIQPQPVITGQPATNQELCIGGALTEALQVTYNGGEGTPLFQWFKNTNNSNSGGQKIIGATSDSYTPSVFEAVGTYYYYCEIGFDGSGCGNVTSEVASVTVVPDPVINKQPLASQTLCQDANPAPLTIDVSGGVNTSYSYQWYSNTTNSNTTGTPLNNATLSSFTPSTNVAGTVYYYCEVTQAAGAGCAINSEVAAIEVKESPIIDQQPQGSAVCVGGSPTILEVSFNNGLGSASYEWYKNSENNTTTGAVIPGATNPTYQPVASEPGTTYYYSIISLSEGGCNSITSQTAMVEVTPQPIVTSQPKAQQQLCVGGVLENPLEVAYSGGSGEATYLWYQNTENNTTNGSPIVSATVSSYEPPSFNSPGDYYLYCIITFKGSGCTSIVSEMAQVTVVPDPIIDKQPLATQTLCQDATPAPLTIEVSGGVHTSYSYQWYSNTSHSNTGGTLLNQATQSSFIPSTNVSGTAYYYCEVTQAAGAGCAVSSTVAMIQVNDAPTLTEQPLSSTLCLGETVDDLKISFANGVGTPQYQWYSNTVDSSSNGKLIAGATSASFSPNLSAVGTTYYYCELVFTSGSCAKVTSEISKISILPIPDIQNFTETICGGASFKITPENATHGIVPQGTTYSWSAPVFSTDGAIVGASASEGSQNNITQTLSNITENPVTATYTVYPKSGRCEGLPFEVVITVNPAITANVVTKNMSCHSTNDAFLSATITVGIPFNTGAPYKILWTGPAGYTASTSEIGNLKVGTYTLSIEDDGGCSYVESYEVTEPEVLAFDAISYRDISCFGLNNGSIGLHIQGGTTPYTFQWTKDNIPFSTSKDIANLSQGAYKVVVSDSNGCSAITQEFTITEPPLLEVFLEDSTNIYCYGAKTGSIAIEALGGTPFPLGPNTELYTYRWTGPNGFNSTDKNVSNLASGTYHLVVTDQQGCMENLSVTLSQPQAIAVKVTTTDLSCYESNDASISLDIDGGTAPYDIKWNTLASGNFQDNLAAGTYTITITDARNCSKDIVVDIPQAPIFTTRPVVKEISCYGANNGSITLNIVGGEAPVSLEWDDNPTAGNQRNNLGPGTYTVRIKDDKPCEIVKTFTLIEPGPLALSSQIINALECDTPNSGAINLMITGGTAPFSTIWSSGETSEDLSAVPPGDYQVKVVDARGCETSAIFTISRPSPLKVTVATETTYDCDTKMVRQDFIAEASGGVPPYQYSWSNSIETGAYNQYMHTNTNGMVILEVQDAAGCKTNYTFEVEIPKLGNAGFNTDSYAYQTFGQYSIMDPITFNNQATGDYETISWDFGDGNYSNEITPTHSYMAEGSYMVTQTVRYPLGCEEKYSTSLIIDKGYLLIIPNAFTPNNDGLNDYFRPKSKGLKEISLLIYNTWGGLVYSEFGDDIQGWDGTVRNRPTENGNYYYKVKAKTFYDKTIIKEGGFITIK
ncbi:hypothetical protein KCTC52924_00833 [Arenibacter antarcticus]|uniref:PKD domain-containing protein n=1 Tax=Arenibacter antarcticus TaxID=2040469 RepID=A0ABW5VBZ8_9FLAO|nr:PKD domain-containing protein [Arenibacter sp. H213]